MILNRVFLKLFFIFFSVLYLHDFTSQTNAHIDSLKNQIAQNTNSDTSKILQFIELADIYADINLEKSIVYAQMAFQESIKLKNFTLVTRSSLVLGNYFRLQGTPEAAMYYYERSIIAYKILGDVKNLSKALGNQALVFLMKSKFAEALSISFEVLRLAEKSNDIQALIAVHNSIGNIYYSQGNFAEALLYFEKALDFLRQEKVISASKEFTLQQNIANVQLDLGNYNEAEKYIAANEQIAIANQSTDFMYVVHIQRGYLNFELSQYEAAILNFESALDVAEDLGSISYLASVYLEIGRTYLNWAKLLQSAKENQTRLKQAVFHLNKSARLFLQIDNLNEYQYVQSLISESYEGLGDFQNAFYAHKEYLKYKDSLFHGEKLVELTRIEMDHLFTKKQDSTQHVNSMNLALKEAKLVESKKQIVLLAVVSIVLIIIGWFIFKQNRIIKKKNKELMASNALKLRFFNLINHDMRSPIAHLLQSLYIQRENPDFGDLLEKNINAVENLYESMDDLLLWSKGQMTQFAPHNNHIQFSELIRKALTSVPVHDKVQLELILEDGLVLMSDENYLKTIIRNLVNNALHALKDSSSPKIMIKIWQDEDAILLSIADNGKGADLANFSALNDDQAPIGIKNGLGFHLIRDLSKAIDCEISAQSELNIGTTITLKFLKKQA